eukprot:TRINITY_DN2478_c0_g1_i2.p1 TRINITY_DN2478_c0_g1~~TRINITY_DN2478_c0_g1_i2.p1  ORF type:complete len:732 (-),score=146.95 TRINITY_DN2478_c0_g1_i2:111-2306(-)
MTSRWVLALQPSAKQCLNEWRCDPHATLAFYLFAENQQVAENLHFIFQAQEYASLPCSIRRGREDEYMERYIVADAPEKINIAAPILEALVDGCGYGRARVFERAAGSCLEMIALGPWADFKDIYYSGDIPVAPIPPLSIDKLKLRFEKVLPHSVYPAVMWSLFNVRTEVYMAPLIAAGKMQKWLFKSPKVSKILVHSFTIDADPVALVAVINLFPFVENLYMEFMDEVMAGELAQRVSSKNGGGGATERRKKKKKGKRKAMGDDLLSLIVFEEFFELVGRKWLNELLAPTIEKIYQSSPHKYATNPEENTRQLEHVATTIAETLLDRLHDSPPPPLLLYTCAKWTRRIGRAGAGSDASSLPSWFLRVICKALLAPNQRLDLGCRYGRSGHHMATLVTDLLYSIFSPPGTRSYGLSEHALEKMQETHADAISSLSREFFPRAKYTSLVIKGDLEATKHLAYQLCATATELTESFSSEELGDLATFFVENEALTKKLKVRAPVSFQDQKEGYQNVFAMGAFEGRDEGDGERDRESDSNEDSYLHSRRESVRSAHSDRSGKNFFSSLFGKPKEEKGSGTGRARAKSRSRSGRHARTSSDHPLSEPLSQSSPIAARSASVKRKRRPKDHKKSTRTNLSSPNTPRSTPTASPRPSSPSFSPSPSPSVSPSHHNHLARSSGSAPALAVTPLSQSAEDERKRRVRSSSSARKRSRSETPNLLEKKKKRSHSRKSQKK